GGVGHVRTLGVFLAISAACAGFVGPARVACVGAPTALGRQRKTKRAAFWRRHALTILGVGQSVSTHQKRLACTAKCPAPVRFRNAMRLRRNMWKRSAGLLRPSHAIL